MKRLFNALRYGDNETRKSIGSVLLFAVLGIGLLIVSGMSGQVFLFIPGMISGVVSLVISQSFELVDEDFVAEVDAEGRKNTVQSVSVKKDGIIFKNSDAFKKEAEQGKAEAIEAAMEALVEAGLEAEQEERRRKKRERKEKTAERERSRKKKVKKEKPEQEELEEKPEKPPKEKTEKTEKKTPKPERKAEESEPEELQEQEHGDRKEADAEEEKLEELLRAYEKYNNQVLKQVKRKHHVKRDHRPIMIDNSKSCHIKECPAFIWRVHNKVYLLLIEKEPRKITIPRERIKHVGYAPHVKGDRRKEYRAFEKQNMITSVFREFLPDYFSYKTERGNYKAKNLYYIYPDIQISNRSIVQVMDLLYLNFMPSDRITRSNEVNGFFKRAYAANLLYNDKAYSVTEYKDAVEKILLELCHAEMPEREFNSTMENMVKAKFISREYAEHYYRVRDKMRRK